MQEAKHIIYGLIEPRTRMVRYIGQSSRGLMRARTHGHESVLAVERTRKANWIKGLRSVGLDFEIVVLQVSTPDSLNSDEEWWIAYARACEWPLTNLKDGAGVQRGWAPSEETCRKISAAHKGKTLTPEHRAKIGEGLKRARLEGRSARSEKQVAAARRNLKLIGEESIQKMAASLRGRKLDPERVAKMSAGSRARWADPEWKARVIAARIGRKRSPESRARMSELMKGRTFSDETRARMSAAQKKAARERQERAAHETFLRNCKALMIAWEGF